MLQYPTNVSPENTAKPADATQMSFTFNGDRLSYINVKATDMATGERISIGYYSEDMGNVLPVYNGDKVTFPPSSQAQGLTDGHNYVWQVMMSQRDLAGENNLYDIPVCRGSIEEQGTGSSTTFLISPNLPIYEWGYNGNDGYYYPTEVDGVIMAGMMMEFNGEYRLITRYKTVQSGETYRGLIEVEEAFTTTPTIGDRYQIYSNYLISPQYYFMCRGVPSLSLTLDYERDGGETVNNALNLCVSGTYSHPNNTPIKYYKLTLYGYADTFQKSCKLKETDRIFSQQIDYNFGSCLLGVDPITGEDITDVTYRVVCDIVTQDNNSYAGYTEMTVEGIRDYAPSIVGLSWNPIGGYACNYNPNTTTLARERCYRTDLDTNEVVRLDGVERSFDFKVSTKGKYKYTTVFYSPDGRPYTLSTHHFYVNTNFTGYYIYALIPNGQGSYTLTDTWRFVCDIDNTTVSQNFDRVQHIGVGRYPSVSSTDLNYMSGTLSGNIGHLNCCDHTFHDDIALVKAWREFISQPHPFLLKSQKGDVWIVNIVDSPQVEYQEDYHRIPTRFTISWAECENVNDVTINYVNAGDYEKFKNSEAYRCSPEIPCEFDVTTDSDYIFRIDAKEAVIIAYVGDYKNPKIPDTLGGYPVRIICATAFYGAGINTVSLPEGIRIIE